MSDIGARIRAVREEKGMSRRAFGATIGLSEAKVQAVEIGKQRVDHDTLAALVSGLGIDAKWLLVGENAPSAVSKGETHSFDFIPIPRFAVEASAGHGSLVENEETTGFYAFNRKWLARRGLNPDRLSIISVKGDSMEPGFCNNDLILVDHDQTRPTDGLIFVFRMAADLFVKHVQLLPDGMMQLISANKLYPPIVVNAAKSSADFQVIGRVVASMHEW